MSVLVRNSQMISFDDRYKYNAAHYFGNPLDMNKILKWALERLHKGFQTNVTITGVPYKVFYAEYAALRKSRGIITVLQKCKECDGSGVITRDVKHFQHWSGVKITAFKGLAFKVKGGCQSCERFGYREFLAPPKKTKRE